MPKHVMRSLAAVGFSLYVGAAAAAGCSPVRTQTVGRPSSDSLYQYGILEDLECGAYDGTTSFGNLAAHGDFGLGAVDALDGELVVVDGEFYHVRDDGRAYRLGARETSPFAILARFEPDISAVLPTGLDFDGLTGHIDALLASTRAIQAIRVDGLFRSILVRSEPRQSPPYRPLAAVMAEQEVRFSYDDVRGTLVGFRIPGYAGSLNVSGYHFHFLNDDRTHGGHVLSFVIDSGDVQIDDLHAWKIELPGRSAVCAEGAR